LDLRLADDSQMAKTARDENLEVYQPSAGTRPMVYYKNISRFIKCFIAGCVASRTDGREDCVEGARVTLLDGAGNSIGEVRTDPFGDFKFDNLEPASGVYTVRVLARGRETDPITVDLGESASMGVIYV
jgi:hypothetical protein